MELHTCMVLAVVYMQGCILMDHTISKCRISSTCKSHMSTSKYSPGTCHCRRD